MRRPLTAFATILALTAVLASCQAETGDHVSTPTVTPSVPPAASAPPTPTANPPELTATRHHPSGTRTVGQGFTTPWGVAFLPDGSALISSRRSDEIVRLTPEGAVTSVGTVPGLALDTDEGGMLGLAIPPGRADVLYAYMTAASDNRVVRMSFDGERLGSPEVVVTGIEKGRNHNGGRIAFGPDGFLFISTGDAAKPELAQDPESLNGKILRVDADGNPAPGNPFGNAVYSYGHRNIQGLAFDSEGTLWATEFGADATDELNRIEAGSNYGWPIVEGDVDDPRFARPFAWWSPTSAASPSGLAILDNVAYIGAHRGQALFVVPLAGPEGGETFRLFENEFGRIRTVQLAPDGALWITTTNRDGYLQPEESDDRIIRVEF